MTEQNLHYKVKYILANLRHSLVPVLFKESEGIVVAKVFKLDQGVLAPTLYDGLSNRNFIDAQRL